MGKEVERKWVLQALPGFPAELEVEEEAIVQAYLVTNPGELRIRRKGGKCFITVKGDGTISRDEWEARLPDWAFEQLLNGSACRLTKTRYTVDDQLELDVYEDRLTGLVVLEVEFGSEEAALVFTPPDWCPVIAEVTDDPRFKNKNLALAEAVPQL